MAKCNKGFSLIELLIAMTILSIVMIMVGQFMSSSTMASKKVKDNLEVQSEAMAVMTNISDTVEQASYVRVTVDQTSIQAKEISDVSGGTATASRTRTVTDATSAICTSDLGSVMNFDLVSDDYPNHIRPNDTERKVIIDFSTYKFVPEKTSNQKYPLSGDLETTPSNGKYLTEVRSFRCLKVKDVSTGGEKYYYVQPKFLYLEYRDVADTSKVVCVIYRFDYTKKKIYMKRQTYAKTTKNRYKAMTEAVDTLCSSGGTEGLVTSSLKDFYLSADVEGNALLFNCLFEENGYQYNSVETTKFRNTNAITVRPQKLYKKKP